MIWFTKSFNFSKYAAEVVRWNGVGYGGHSKPLHAQWELVVEEGGTELVDAFVAKDKKEFLDAVVDTFVVATYYDYLKYGDKPYSKVFMEGVDNCSLLDINFLVHKLQVYIRLGDITGVHKMTFALMNKLDADVEGALEEVLRSNWSKFVTFNAKDEEVYDKECKRIEEVSEGRYTGVKWDVRDNLVVFTDSNGKIVKPMTYSPPELEQFINWGT